MIVRYNPLICLVTLLCLISGLTHSAYAADQKEQRWYRVELLVFTHQSNAAQTSEIWDPTPTLLYPQSARFLVDPMLVEKNLTQFDATGTVDEFGHQTLTFPPSPSARERQTLTKLDVVALGQVPAGRGPTLEEILPTTPSPFILLDNSGLEFHNESAYMQRTGRYRTLFHEAWVQPMEGESSTRAIIIDRSGDTEEWPQLQGSIKIFLSRYLHLETNLWLNTPGQYLPQNWQMPAAPLSPKSLTIIYPLEPEIEPEPVEPAYFISTEVDTAEEMELELLEPTGPLYPWRHAVLLRQKRKMRGNEVHYIDHPMLGLVAKITPLDQEELRAQASAEAARPQRESDM